MAGILSADRIIESEKINQRLQSIGQEVSKLIVAFDKVAESGEKLAKSLGGADNLNKIVKASKEAAKSTEELTFNQAELAKQAQELGKLTAKLEEIETSYNKEIQKTKEAIKQKNAAIKEEITGEKASAEAKKKSAQVQRESAQATKLAAQEEKLKLAVQSQAVGSIRRLQAENQLHAFTIKNKLNPAIKEERAEIIRLNQVINSNKDSIGDMQRKQITGWDRVTRSVGQHLLAYVGFTQVIQLLTNVFTMTKKLDSLQFTMKTVIKDQNELAKTQLFLSETSANYGLDLINLTERYVKFRTAAMQSNLSAKETMSIFNSTAKAAAVLGLATDEVGGVFLALEQMLSKGKVTTEELRRQLGERLPGAFGIMADALGVTLPQLDKMLKAGEILSTEALPKFAIALEKAYGIESVNMINTLAAAQGRLSTSWVKFVDDLQASGVYKFILNQMNDAILSVQTTFGSNSKILDRLSRQTDSVGEKVRKMITDLDKIPYEQLIKQQKQLGDNWIGYLDDWNVHTKEAELLFSQYVDRRKTLLEKDAANNKKVKPFDIDSFQKTLDEAKKEYERFEVIKDDTLKDQFEKTAAFYKKDQVTYKDYINNQIKILSEKTRIAEGLFKVEEASQNSDKSAGKEITKEQKQELSNRYENYLNYVQASAELRMKLLEIDKKGSVKGNQFTDLEKLKEKHKQELDEQAKLQQELLASKERSDQEIALIDKDNRKELLTLRLQQIEFEKVATKGNKEEIAKLESEAYDVRKKLAEETANFIIREDERIRKEQEQNAKIISENYQSDTEHRINLEEERLNIEAANNIKKIAGAKDAADQIRDIEYDLSLAILKFRKQEYEAALLSDKLTIDDKKKYKDLIDNINIAIAENAVDQSKQAGKEIKKSDKERVRSLGDAVNEGFLFSQQIFSNQADSVRKGYEDQIKAAGDSVDARVLAERKYAEEELKIRRKQAIAEKAQAIFNIGLALATATAKLNAFQVIAATLALATAIAKPIPQYFKGTKNAPETFIAGDTPFGKGASEMIIKPSGEMLLTPDKPTLFSDKSFIGSTILPHDKTQAMLANYAVNQGASVFVDMSKSENYLSKMERHMRNNEQRSIDSKGNVIVKRGNITTRYATV